MPSLPRCAGSTRRPSPSCRATGWRPRCGRSPGVTEVRGRGLLLAAEIPGHDAAAVYRSLLDHGLVANAVGPTSLRFAPPLTVSDAEIDEAVTIVDAVLESEGPGVKPIHVLEVADFSASDVRDDPRPREA